jgi:LemA protein
MKIFGFIIAGLAALLVFGSLMAYQGLVSTDENVSAKAGVVRTTEQRRYDLIPNIVATVTAEANFERSTIVQVTEARARVGQMLQVDAAEFAQNPELQQQFLEAQQAMTGALSRLLVTVEAYPNLKSNEGFRNLQVQLEGTENRIQVARRDVQEATNEYNRTRRSLFGLLINAVTGGMFPARDYFEATEGSDVAPRVDFDGLNKQ